MDDREKFVQFQALEQEAKKVSEQIEFFEEQTKDLAKAKQALVDIQTAEAGKEIIVPFAHGIRIKAALLPVTSVLVHVGSDTMVEKTPQQAAELINEQLQAIEKYSEKLTEHLVELSQKADDINKS